MKRELMVPIPGWMVMRGDKRVDSFHEGSPPGNLYLLPGERIAEVEIRERPKPWRAAGRKR